MTDPEVAMTRGPGLSRYRAQWSAYRVHTMDPGGRHEHCQELVLDLTHDLAARLAALRWAEQLRIDGFERLADNVESLVKDLEGVHA